MKNIFQTAQEIGCLIAYLDTLATNRKQSDSAKLMWIERRELQKGNKNEPLEAS